MSRVRTKGFVMASFPYKDRDRMLHILTPDRGLISAGARGACSVKSKLRPLTNQFAFSELDFFYHKNRYYLDDGDLIESFSGISESIERLVAATHAAEVFADLTRNSPPDQRYFDLWAYSIYEISVSDKPVLISRLSSLRLLALAGYAPELNNCTVCQQKIIGSADFSFKNSGLLCGRATCSRDLRSDIIRLSADTITLLNYVLRTPVNRMYRFTVSEEVIRNVSGFLDFYLSDKMEKDYKKLGLLEQEIDLDLSNIRPDCD